MGYAVKVDAGHGCWSAQTYKLFGANQGLIDAYRNDEFLAPSKAEVHRLVRQGRLMRHLKGCTSNNTGKISGASQPAKFMAAFAAQNVQRTYDGEQRVTRCHYAGKDEVPLAPDAYQYHCQTVMADGRHYLDNISCFDKPPYTSYDSCSEDDGYPRKPPRALP
jgi:hypothetical protein